MKQIVFVLLVSFSQPTVKVDTAYASIIRAANPAKSNYIEAVVFYDREYFKRWIAEPRVKCDNCELIDVEKGILTTIHKK